MEETRRLFADRVRLLGGVAKVAELLECSRQYVDMLANGTQDKRPSLDMARRIEDRMGVPMRGWALSSSIPSTDPDESAA